MTAVVTELGASISDGEVARAVLVAVVHALTTFVIGDWLAVRSGIVEVFRKRYGRALGGVPLASHRVRPFREESRLVVSDLR